MEDFKDGQDEIITLVDEDNVEHDFTIVDIVQVDDFEYAILLPVEPEEEGEGEEAFILKFEKDEEGNEILVDIEDDEEWEKVADTWQTSLLGGES